MSKTMLIQAPTTPTTWWAKAVITGAAYATLTLVGMYVLLYYGDQARADALVAARTADLAGCYNFKEMDYHMISKVNGKKIVLVEVNIGCDTFK